MYFCIGKENNEYIVIDSEDNVEERFSETNIINFLESGIIIYGLTLESLSIYQRTTVLVDYPSKQHGVGQVFNGFYFEDYTSELYDDLHEEYFYSVIIADTSFDLNKYLRYIQQANNSILLRLQNLVNSKVGYIPLDFFPVMFNGVSVVDNSIYGFTYSDVCYTLIHDKVSFKGLKGIDSDFVYINDSKFSLIDSINFILDSQSQEDSRSYFCKLNESDYIEKLQISSSDVISFLRDYGDKKLTETHFPMVCLFNYLKESSVYESTLIHRLSGFSSVFFSRYIKREGNNFVFEDGVSIDFESALTLEYDIKDSNFYNDVENYKKIKQSMSKLATGKVGDFNQVLDFRYQDFYKTGDRMKWSSINDVITLTPHYNILNLSYGLLVTSTYIRPNRANLKNIDAFPIFSMKSVGYYYKISRSGITIYLNDSLLDPKYSSHNFVEYIDEYRNDLGYYYSRPNIIPLFVHSVVDDMSDAGIQINVLVMINANNFNAFSTDMEEKEAGWGMYYLVVPLLLTGTRHYIKGDFVIFDMLFQELAISKAIYDNMFVDINESNDLVSIDNCSKTSSAKYCNCDIGVGTSKPATRLKEVFKRGMVTFNRVLEGV